MSHVVSSETVMNFRRLIKIFESDNGLMVQVRCERLPKSEDTLDPLSKVGEDFLQPLLNFLDHRSPPVDVAAEPRRNLHLYEGECSIMP